jgi:hypothetical protein
MTTVTKIARILYIAVAFASSWLTSPMSPLIPAVVYGQSRVVRDDQISRAEDSIQAERLANAQRFDAIDKRMNDIGERVSNIQGIGFGAFSVLGVLQIVGMIGAKRKDE